MVSLVCKVQSKLTAFDKIDALAEGVCRHCGQPAWKLQASGQRLEVCGDEYLLEIDENDKEIEPLPLCPDCHKAHHLDGKRHHNPCPFKARRSRESLGLGS